MGYEEVYKNLDNLSNKIKEDIDSVLLLNTFDKSYIESSISKLFSDASIQMNKIKQHIFRKYIINKLEELPVITFGKYLSCSNKNPIMFSENYDNTRTIKLFDKVLYTSLKTNVEYEKFDETFEQIKKILVESDDKIETNIKLISGQIEELELKVEDYFRKHNMEGYIDICRNIQLLYNSPLMEVNLKFVGNNELSKINYNITFKLLYDDISVFKEKLDIENILLNIRMTIKKLEEKDVNNIVVNICKKYLLKISKFTLDKTMDKPYDLTAGKVGCSLNTKASDFEKQFVTAANTVTFLYNNKPDKPVYLDIYAGTKYFYKKKYDKEIDGDRYEAFDVRAGEKTILLVYKNGEKVGIKGRRKLLKKL